MNLDNGYVVYSKNKLYKAQERFERRIDWSAVIPLMIYIGLSVGLLVFWLMQNPENFTWLKG